MPKLQKTMAQLLPYVDDTTIIMMCLNVLIIYKDTESLWSLCYSSE